MKLTAKKQRKLLTAMKDYVATNRSCVVSDCIKYMQQGRIKYAIACLQSESDKIEQPLRSVLEKIHVLDDLLWYVRYKKYRRRAGLEGLE